MEFPETASKGCRSVDDYIRTEEEFGRGDGGQGQRREGVEGPEAGGS